MKRNILTTIVTFTLLLSPVVASALSYTWVQRTSVGKRVWAGLTLSADGTKLAATDSAPGYIYTSTDGGVTWTQRTSAGSQWWPCIASSADGTKLAACVITRTVTFIPRLMEERPGPDVPP